jgi:flagellar P-ring protein precursor FlgI
MKNHPTVGACMAQVVNEICLPEDLQPNLVSFNLRNKEYLTASRITSAINEVFPNSARALDKGSVEVAIPDAFQRNRIEFIAMVNQLRVRPYEPARVVINRRSGTIVMGQNVRISNVVFANENLVITTTENPVASQPAPFSDGQTVVLPRTQIQAFSESGRYNVLNSGITVHEFAAALNAMGVAPTDLINVFEAIHRQGGLHAELIFE